MKGIKVGARVRIRYRGMKRVGRVAQKSTHRSRNRGRAYWFKTGRTRRERYGGSLIGRATNFTLSDS